MCMKKDITNLHMFFTSINYIIKYICIKHILSAKLSLSARWIYLRVDIYYAIISMNNRYLQHYLKNKIP